MFNFKIYKVFLVAFLSSFAFIVADDKPNILYINIDDLGVMDLGYQATGFRTPNIDRLAKEGMMFSNAYAPAANCAPSRASVFSGQVPARHGVYTVASSERGRSEDRKLIPIKNTLFLKDEVITLAEALKDGGYTNIHLGKWHCTKDPLKAGFDVNIGGDHTGSPAAGYYSPWKRGSMNKYNKSTPKKTHRIEVYTREARKFIDENKKKPMFIHFSPYMVHTPLTVVPEYIKNYKERSRRGVYASMVEKMDEAVGEILDAIDDNDLKEKTLVVFCSDNGGIAAISSQAPFRAGKGSYYEGGIREPLVMRWPNKIKAGLKVNTPVTALDFYPTFLDVAGLSIPKNKILDGVSLKPLMLQSGRIKERALYWHFPIYLQAYKKDKDDGRDPLFRTRPGSAMRFGKWKLHEYFEDGGFELYNLEVDLGERQNLTNSMPEKLAELKEKLIAWRKDTKGLVPKKLNPEYKKN